MRAMPVLIVTFLILGRVSHGDEPKPDSLSAEEFFERLDANGDGKVALKEAPEQGKMLVEFLLRMSGKNVSDQLGRAEFIRLTHRQPAEDPRDKTTGTAIGAGDVKPAPDNCAACAMGLTAEFVFKRLDVDEDKLITVAEFMRSPGMQDMSKARDAVARIDDSGDGKLSWAELQAAYKSRHANCKKPDPATLARETGNVRPDGRGNGSRFAQVFILRSDQDGDGKISKEEFRGQAFGFKRLDKNGDGFIEADELGDLHQRRLNDPKSMQERLKSGEVPRPLLRGRPNGLPEVETKKEKS